MIVIVGQVVQRWGDATSGEPIPVAGAVASVAFWVWLIFFLPRLSPDDMDDADRIRDNNRKVMLQSGSGWRSPPGSSPGPPGERGFDVRMLWSPLLPGLVFLGAWFGRARADTAAAKTSEPRASRAQGT